MLIQEASKWDIKTYVLDNDENCPAGVPVAAVALNGAKNAAILAAQIVSAMDISIQNKIIQYKHELEEQVLSKSKKLIN